ncbi:MAG: galactokinase [Phycisphaerales bacterium]|nr:galactokinase [Phycisphaerales bacterium]
MNALDARVRELFAHAFEAQPSATASAPGRVNLIGDHVDYAGGVVLPAALRLRTAVSITLREDAARRMVSEHVSPHWTRYCDGVANLLGVGGFDLAVASDLPIGAGLASSAALEVATLRAFLAALHRSMEVLEGAQLCQRAEHESAGVPCGLMDQLVVMVDGVGSALCIDFSNLAWHAVAIPRRAEFLVFDSGVRHALADGRYAERRASVTRAAHSMTDIDRRRAQHVVEETARAKSATLALTQGDLEQFGTLMCESHASLRDQFEVSVEEADALVSWLTRTPAVFGARITGGGFGGCVVALIERGEGDGVAAAVQSQFAHRFGHAPLLVARV